MPIKNERHHHTEQQYEQRERRKGERETESLFMV